MPASETTLEELWQRKSWVDSANRVGSDFPLQNLPFCAFETSPAEEVHLGAGIGDFVLDLHATASAGLFDHLGAEVRSACTGPHLNPLMQCGRAANSLLRHSIMRLLREDADAAHRSRIESFLYPQTGTAFRLPVQVGDYSDFYASVHHATNVGRLFRPDQPLLPNYKFIPIGYHGRASSLVVSETAITRPRGQTQSASDGHPSFGPTKQLDYEIEVGAYIGAGNTLGQPISIDSAEQHLFGISLLNDWSARDIQAWEYQPLGPFLGKSFATSLSPWVVSMEALAPFRVPIAPRPAGDPAPLPYLRSPATSPGALDITLEVHLSTAAMCQASVPPVLLSSSNLRDLYWSFAQMLTHHTSNGCNLRTGDLLASGTVSGPSDRSLGSLLEITRRGSHPLRLPGGELRGFLEEGDQVILRGFCERPGVPRIGLGECRGIVSGLIAQPHPQPA